MQQTIGSMAGAIWQALNAQGELNLKKLKAEVGGKTPVFDWAIGWLAREDQISILQDKDKESFRIRLKHNHVHAMSA